MVISHQNMFKIYNQFNYHNLFYLGPAFDIQLPRSAAENPIPPMRMLIGYVTRSSDQSEAKLVITPTLNFIKYMVYMV